MIYPFGIGRHGSSRTSPRGIAGILLFGKTAVLELAGSVLTLFQMIGAEDALAALLGSRSAEELLEGEDDA